VRIFSGDINTAAWSPDGAQIAFEPDGGDLSPGLYVINRDGSGLKLLSERTGWILWSPRGDRIALQGPGLYLVEVSTGDTNEIPDATQAPWYASSVSWSPDGTLLAFVNESGLYTYDADTGHRDQVAVGPSAFPMWSPDGSRIVFRFGPRVPFLYDPEAAIQGPYVVETNERTEPKPLPMASTMSWSPDGSRIAYLEHGCITGAWDIYTVDPDGGSPVRLTTMPGSAKEGPFWSPTGATIAFSTFGQLILTDAESGELRTLVVSGTPESYNPGIHLHGPVWSPDGRYILFGAGGAHGVCD
jgi:Tol biopolymer transport system component